MMFGSPFVKASGSLRSAHSTEMPFKAIENIEADKVVELFPGLLETLQEPAMLLYDVTWRQEN